MPFAEAFAFTVLEEGGYVNDPVDRGGATNYGVTQATYDLWRRVNKLPGQQVRNISKKEVELVYRMFWDDGGCEFVEKHDSKLALAHFDACINHGGRNATKILQRAVDLSKYDDGLWGPQTRAAVAGHTRYEKDKTETLRRLLELRENFYLDIVYANHTQLKFLRGWLFRVRRLRRKVLPCS